jgi:hypothetical protein
MTSAAVLLALGALACAGRPTDCGAVPEGEPARDACFAERAWVEAQAGRAPAAKEALRAIGDPLVRAAATDRVLTGAPALGSEEAAALCRELPAPLDRSCFDTWSRPHLWSPSVSGAAPGAGPAAGPSGGPPPGAPTAGGAPPVGPAGGGPGPARAGPGAPVAQGAR